MPNACAVLHCVNSAKNKSCKDRFFRFPKDKHVCDMWVQACKRNVNVQQRRICSLHFTDDDWCLKHKLLNIPISKRRLDPKAIPTQNLPENCDDNSPNITIERIVEERNTKKIVDSCIEDFEQRCLQKHNISQYLEEEVPYDDSLFKRSVQTQTNVNLECSKERRIKELEDQLQKCRKEKEKIRLECNRLRSLETSVKAIFTEGQIKRLKNPKSKINWKLDDIFSAVQLHSMGPRTYQHLYKNKYPLPGLSTLKQWAPKIKAKSQKPKAKEESSNEIKTAS